MVDITEQVREGQKKWGRGINIDSDIDIIEINNFVQFKILEYEAYNFKDDELWEAYKEDFNNFTLQIFRDYNQHGIRKL